MEVKVNIVFDQLLQLMKKLPAKQLARLKAEISKQSITPSQQDLKSFLLQAPTMEQSELDTIMQTRQAINQWRKK